MPDPQPTSEKANNLPSWTFEPGHTEAGFRARSPGAAWS
jgi:hypothetical protein